MIESKEKILVGRRDAAELLAVSARTIDNLIREKRIPVKRIGARVLFLRTDLESFAKRATK